MNKGDLINELAKVAGTKKEIKIAARKVPKFTPGKNLKVAVK